MSNEKMVTGYEVTVRGQYQSVNGKDRTLRNFGPAVFFIPEYVEIPNGKKKVNKKVDGRTVQMWEPQTKKCAATTDNVALYVVQRRLLPTWLAEKHPDAAQFRTCNIVPGSMKRVTRKASDVILLDKPIAEMSMQELAAFCKMKGLNVPVTAFADVKEARETVEFEHKLQTGAPTPGAGAGIEDEDRTDREVHGIQTANDAAEGDVPTDRQDEAADLLR